MENRKVAVEDIHVSETCQARADVHHDAIAEYGALVAAGTELPPLRCARVGGALYLIDGYHRHAAYRTAGLQWCRVTVEDVPSMHHAEWLATGANQGHGLRRSNADKRRAVRMALANPIGAEQSSRAIAEHVGVSDMLVGEIRKEIEARQLQESCSSVEPPKRIGKDGKARPATQPKRVPDLPQTDSVNQSAPPPEPWTPPPSRPVKPETRQVRQPMPDAAPMLRAAEILRGARLELAKVLPSEMGGILVMLQREEGTIRAAIPVVCSECSGSGCPGCQRRGWRTTGNDRTEARRARA